MVPLVVWLCEETERSVRTSKCHKSLSPESAMAFKTLLEIQAVQFGSKKKEQKQNIDRQ